MTVQLVAIDFGTTFSGYAFSVTEPGSKLTDVELLVNQVWISDRSEVTSLKTTTSLLITKEKDIIAFGYDAEEQYADLIMDEMEDHYYFFHRFKMELYDNEITSGMVLKDVRGQTLPAIDVFALSIQALKDHLERSIKMKNISLDNERTKWVLTVPAMWTDRAKQFMRESTELAGIPGHMLKIALEPEAASIYCQTYTSPGSKEITKTGSKYVVADIGGGTVDITVHEKLIDGKLKELVRAIGKPIGGTHVDKAFYQMITEVFGLEILKIMKSDYPMCHLDLFRSFETVKRTIYLEKTGYVNVTIPYVTLDTLCQKVLNKDIRDVVKSCQLSDNLKLFRDKLRIKASLALSFFLPTCNKIVTVIRSVLEKGKLFDIVGIILLVGGFSECKVLQTTVLNAFLGQDIILQEDPGTAVLKGAVLFGYKSDYISSRVARYTYGISVTTDFNENKHAKHRKVSVEGKDKCENVVGPFMEVNTFIPLGHEVEKQYFTNEKFQKSCLYRVFYTNNENVMYTDEDDCNPLGEFSLDILNPTEHFREMKAIFHFGDTEFSLTAVDVESNYKVKKFFEIKD